MTAQGVLHYVLMMEMPEMAQMPQQQIDLSELQYPLAAAELEILFGGRPNFFGVDVRSVCCFLSPVAPARKRPRHGRSSCLRSGLQTCLEPRSEKLLLHLPRCGSSIGGHLRAEF